MCAASSVCKVSTESRGSQACRILMTTLPVAVITWAELLSHVSVRWWWLVGPSAGMKNVGRCATREKVIMLLNGMFQIKKRSRMRQWVSQHSLTRQHLSSGPRCVASACNSASSNVKLKVLTAMLMGFGVSRDRTLYILVDSHGIFCQQMHLLLKHKMLQFVFKISFLIWLLHVSVSSDHHQGAYDGTLPKLVSLKSLVKAHR